MSDGLGVEGIFNILRNGCGIDTGQSEKTWGWNRVLKDPNCASG